MQAPRIDMKARTRRVDYLILIAVACYAIALRYSFGTKDHSQYIPLLRSYLDPSLYPNDLLMKTRDAHCTWFWWLLSFPASLTDNLPLFMFAAHVLVSIGTAWAVFRLAMVLTGNRLSSYLAVLALTFGPYKVFGAMGVSISGVGLTQTTFALPFLIYAMELLLRRRYTWAFLVAGAMFNLHARSAGYVIVMLAVWAVWNIRELGWKGLARCAAAVVCSASPTIVLAVNALVAAYPLTESQYAQYLQALRVRVYWHVFPSEWTLRTWLRGTSFLLLAGCSYWVCRLRTQRRFEYAMIAYFAFAVAIMCLIGTIFVEWFPIWRPILTMSFWRSTKFLAVLGVIFIAHSLVVSLAEEQLGRIAVWGGICALVFWPVLGLSQLSAWWLLAFWPFFSDRRIRASLVLMVVVAVSVLRFPPPEFLICFAAGTLVLVTLIAVERKKTRLATSKVVIILSLALLLLPVIRPTRRLRLRPKIMPTGRWFDLQQWCEQNTNPDDVFLTPYHRMGFRVMSKRSPYAEFKDGGPAEFVPQVMLEWLRRMYQYGEDSNFRSPSQRALVQKRQMPEDILRMAREAGVSYVVVAKPRELPLPLAYKNKGFRVYKMDSQLRGRGTSKQNSN